MKKSLLIFCSLIYLSCSSSNTDMEVDEPTRITQEELDQLNKPCVDESFNLQVPSKLTDPSTNTLNEHTLLIWSYMELNNQFRTNLQDVLLPPATAIQAEIDNITITADDRGYEWSVGNERYVYLFRENGYQLYYYDAESLSGRELIYLSQDSNCDQMDYIQYAIENDGEKEIGDIVFKYNFQKAGTAKIATFGSNLFDSNSEEIRFSSFEDLSGEIIISFGGKISKKLSWASNGDGRYEIFEDGDLVDEGTWMF